MMFRLDFPADDVNCDEQADQPSSSESLVDPQDYGCPVHGLEKPLPLPIEQHPIHHEFPPQHIIQQDPDCPRFPHESHYTNLLRHKNNLSNDQTPQTPQPQYPQSSQPRPQPQPEPQYPQYPQNSQPQYPSFTHSTHAPSQSNIMPRDHYEDPNGPSNRYNNQRIQTAFAKQHAELRGLREVIQEDRRRIEHLQSEVTHRDIQIRALKHTISKVRTNNIAMATDSQIENDYKYLVAQLKNWTLSHFRGCKPTNISQTLTDFGHTDPNTVSSAAKLLAENTPRICQAVTMLVMSYLNKHVFSVFLFGASDPEQQLLQSLDSSFIKTATERDVHFWRSNTLNMVVATEDHKRSLRDRKKELVAQIESLLANTVPAGGNAGKRVDSLKIVVDQAVALALTLRVQRAHYYLYHHGPGEKLDKTFMEMEGDADDDSDDGSGGESSGGGRIMGLFRGRGQKKTIAITIGLTVFPALIKGGNDEGEDYDKRVCLFKAKVLRG